MQRIETSALPKWCSRDVEYLYAAMRADGIVKIGRTRNPADRMGGLYDQFKRVGAPMLGVYVVKAERRSVSEAEAELVALCRGVGEKVGNTREFFSGLTWDVVKPLLHQAARAGE